MTLLPARTMIYVMRRKGGLTKIGVSDNPKRRRADLGGGAELAGGNA